ncbi:MAG: YetF domain-containing protein [Bacillus sp. (in: firmicutes)]
MLTLIRDEKVLWDEIRDLKFDESWLKAQLQSHSISNYKEVFIAEWLKEDRIFVQTYHN